MLTMPDLKWTVRVDRWNWIYSFTRFGIVHWRDPNNGEAGRGTWRMEGGKMITRWVNSKTWEAWDVPLDPSDAWGECHMDGKTYELRAVAQNFYLQPGDVMYVGQPVIRTNGTLATVIYTDEVRTGGTIAWICRNPGNIREGDRYGAYNGKKLTISGIGSYAIFPDETTGLMAIVSVLRSYGRVTIKQAMNKYAPKKDGHNDPDKYAQVLAAGLKVSDSTLMTTLSDEQVLRMATLATGVETTTPGTTYARDAANVPKQIQERLQ